MSQNKPDELLEKSLEGVIDQKARQEIIIAWQSSKIYCLDKRLKEWPVYGFLAGLIVGLLWGL